jgi:hypothetical protein
MEITVQSVVKEVSPTERLLFETRYNLDIEMIGVRSL